MPRYVKLFTTITLMGSAPLPLWIGCEFSDIDEASILAAGFLPVESFTADELSALDIKEWLRITPFQQRPLERLGIRV